jgi:hypothetical protein
MDDPTWRERAEAAQLSAEEKRSLHPHMGPSLPQPEGHSLTWGTPDPINRARILNQEEH